MKLGATAGHAVRDWWHECVHTTQDSLMSLDWPSELLEQDICRPIWVSST